MKAVLSGVYLHNFFSIRAFLGKWTGMVASIAGSLSMGRQGAYVHMSCCIAQQLYTRVRWFQEIAQDYSTRIQMLAAAISVGACVTWSTPIGGVFLAMELTATHFIVGTILKCFLASVIGITCLHYFYSWPYIKATKHTEYEEGIGLNHEIIFIIILGVLSAKVAVAFNHILTKLLFLRVKLKNPFISNRWKWCSMVSLFISFISFPIMIFHFSEK